MHNAFPFLKMVMFFQIAPQKSSLPKIRAMVGVFGGGEVLQFGSPRPGDETPRLASSQAGRSNTPTHSHSHPHTERHHKDPTINLLGKKELFCNDRIFPNVHFNDRSSSRSSSHGENPPRKRHQIIEDEQSQWKS